MCSVMYVGMPAGSRPLLPRKKRDGKFSRTDTTRHIFIGGIRFPPSAVPLSLPLVVLCIDGLEVNLVFRTQHFLGRSSDAHDSPFSSPPGETFPSIDLCPRCRLSARTASTVHIGFLSQKEFSRSPFQLLVLACESGGNGRTDDSESKRRIDEGYEGFFCTI